MSLKKSSEMEPWNRVQRCLGVCVLVRSTLADLDEADDDDERQSQELRRGKEVLHSGGGPHAVAVHERQQDCRGRETEAGRDCKWQQLNEF